MGPHGDLRVVSLEGYDGLIHPLLVGGGELVPLRHGPVARVRRGLFKEAPTRAAERQP
jgi:hypothetical protein